MVSVYDAFVANFISDYAKNKTYIDTHFMPYFEVSNMAQLYIFNDEVCTVKTSANKCSIYMEKKK